MVKSKNSTYCNLEDTGVLYESCRFWHIYRFFLLRLSEAKFLGGWERGSRGSSPLFDEGIS